jgi:hypothetical protein
MTWMTLSEARTFEIPNGTTVDLTALAATYTRDMGWAKPESVKELAVGQVAFVYSYGDWRRGVVTKIGRTKATVTFVTRTGVDNARAGTGWGQGAQLKVTAKSESVDGLLVTPTPVQTVPSITQGAAPAPEVAERAEANLADADQLIQETEELVAELEERHPELAPAPANHVLVDPQGAVVKEGDALPGHNFGPGVFRGITRVPGDGTSTGGKILADWESWAGKEGYPPPGYRIVPAASVTPAAPAEEAPAVCGARFAFPGRPAYTCTRAPHADRDHRGTNPAGAVAAWDERSPHHLPALRQETRVQLMGRPRPEGFVDLMPTPRPGPEDLSDLALSLAAEELEHVAPEEERPAPADPPAVTMDVVTIHRGDRLYEVVRLDGMSHLDGQAQVAPCDPEDHRAPFWVGLDLLHVRAPLGSYQTEEITERVRQAREPFSLPDGRLVVIRTILVDSARVPRATLVEAPLGLVSPPAVAALRVGEALMVDGRCFRVMDVEGTGDLTLEPARWRARLEPSAA